MGLGDPDDAAVWKLDDSRALVLTTDFFTPVVDDPFDYGSIAAANSLSDIYAMGGQPFLALNVAAFPSSLPPDTLGEILRGGAEKAFEAGVVIAGGHTVKDDEPKYGLVAAGFVHPERMLTKGGVKEGDCLVLTKPLGMGVTTTAIKQEKAAPKDIDEAVRWMKRLNREAAALAVEFDLHGATDVTGYSLLGHGLEMARASRVGLRFTYAKIPFTESAHQYAGMGTFPGGAFDNRKYFGPNIHFASGIKEESQMLLFDPQTSGGLLLAVPEKKVDAFLEKAEKIHQPVWVIGEARRGKTIEVA